MGALDMPAYVVNPALAGPLAPDRAGRMTTDDDEALREACQQFEAVLLSQMMQKMRDTVPENALLGDSRAQKIYYSMLDWELAQQISRTQSVGLAGMLYRQLSGLVHGQPDPQGAPEQTPGSADHSAGG